MVASAKALELVEDLASVEASVGDVIRAKEAGLMARKTWDFGPLLMTKKMIAKLEKEGMFPIDQAKPPQGKTAPSPLFSRITFHAAFIYLLSSSFAKWLRILTFRFII